MQANELVNHIQQRYVHELRAADADELPYFVGFLNELTADDQLAALEGNFAIWVQVENKPHLMTVQLVDGTYEVQGVPQHEWHGVNRMPA